MKKLIKSLLGHKTFFLAALVYTALISMGSLVNPGVLPKIDQEVSDKTIHFFGYFFFTIVWFVYAIFKNQKSSYSILILVVGCFSFIYGTIIEILQGVLTATRQPDIFDVFANGLGVIAASLLLLIFKNKILSVKSKF